MKKSVYVKEDLKSVILHYAEVNTYFFILIFFSLAIFISLLHYASCIFLRILKFSYINK